MLVTVIATSWSRPQYPDHADGAAPHAGAGCARGHRDAEYSGVVERAAHQGEGQWSTSELTTREAVSRLPYSIRKWHAGRSGSACRLGFPERRSDSHFVPVRVGQPCLAHPPRAILGDRPSRADAVHVLHVKV